MSGISTVNLAPTVFVDEVLGNKDGSTMRIPINQLRAQLDAEMGGPNYETRSSLYADLAWAAGSLGTVWGDGVEAQRGQYKKLGASGTGSWQRFANLPQTSLTTTQLAAKLDVATFVAAQERLAANGAGVAIRPGEQAAAFAATYSGAPDGLPPLTDTPAITTQVLAGLGVAAVVQNAAVVIAPRAAWPVQPGRVYRAHAYVQRLTDGADPAGNTVRFALRQLDAAYADEGPVLLQDRVLRVADGRHHLTGTFAVAPGALAVADVTLSTATVYVRPYVRIYTKDHRTAVAQIEITDITEAALIDGALDVVALEAAVEDAQTAAQATAADRAQTGTDRIAAEAAAGEAVAALGAGYGTYEHLHLFATTTDTMVLPLIHSDDLIAQILIDGVNQTREHFTVEAGVVTFDKPIRAGHVAAVYLSKRVPTGSVAADDIVGVDATGLKVLKGTLRSGLTFSTRAAMLAALALHPDLLAVGTTLSAEGADYRYIGSGTVIADMPGWVPKDNIFSPVHWGAKGDVSADDGAEINAAWAAYKAVVESAADQLGGHFFSGLGRIYRSTISINMTGTTGWQYGLRDFVLRSEAAGEIALDITGSRGMRMDQVLVYGVKEAMPRIGIYAARAASGGQEAFADQCIWVGVKTRGYFSEGGFVGYGQESLTTIGCEFWNRQFDASAGILVGADVDPGDSDYLPAITTATSHINCHHSRPEFRYLPESSPVSAIASVGVTTVCTLISPIFAVGDKVTLGPVNGLSGGFNVESVNATVTAVGGSLVEIDVDTSAWSAYGGTGITLYRSQTKPTLVVGAVNGMTFDTPYIVSHGYKPIEINWIYANKPIYGLYFRNCCIEAFGLKSYVDFNVGPNTGQIVGFEFSCYQGRAIESYFSVQSSGAGKVQLQDARLAVLSVYSGLAPFFSNASKFFLYDTKVVTAKASMLTATAAGYFLGQVTEVDTGKTYNVGFPRVAGDISVIDASIWSGTYAYDTTLGSSGGPTGVQRGNLTHIRRAPGGGETQTMVVESSSNALEVPAGSHWTRSRVTGAWTNWLCPNVADSGTNYTKHVDGRLEMWGTVTTSASAEAAVVFPVNLHTAVGVPVTLTVNSAGVSAQSPRYTNKTVSGIDVSCMNNANARIATSVDWRVVGRWKA